MNFDVFGAALRDLHGSKSFDWRGVASRNLIRAFE
jgi:hypothetical protein